jgi:predicted P-loop ATPase
MSDDEIPTETTDNIIPLDVVVKARKESKKRKKPEKESLDGREVSRDPVYIRTVITALKGWDELEGLIYFDTFSSRIMRNRKVPGTNPVDEELPVPWMDRDTLALQVYMGRWLVKVEKGLLFDAVSHMAYENARSSAAEFFGGLDPWDGVERLDDFFVKVCNIDQASPQHDYVRQVSRRIFIGLVARVFKPGCKMETAPILEGAQGVLKSSLLEAMAMKDKWYSNKMPHNLSDVDTKDHIKGKLIVELPELVQMRGKEAEETKAFMSISVDEHRSKFGRNPHIFYRQCVFFGSTNEKHSCRRSMLRQWSPTRTASRGGSSSMTR